MAATGLQITIESAGYGGRGDIEGAAQCLIKAAELELFSVARYDKPEGVVVLEVKPYAPFDKNLMVSSAAYYGVKINAGPSNEPV